MADAYYSNSIDIIGAISLGGVSKTTADRPHIVNFRFIKKKPTISNHQKRNKAKLNHKLGLTEEKKVVATELDIFYVPQTLACILYIASIR